MTCSHLSYTSFDGLKEKFERCVLVLDFFRLNPGLLKVESENFHTHKGIERDVLFL